MGAINEKGSYYFPCQIKCNAGRSRKAVYLGENLIRIPTDGNLYELYNLKGERINYELYSEMANHFDNGYLYAKKYRLFGKDKSGKIDISGNFIED